MGKDELEYIRRIYDCLQIPGSGGGGMQSASLRGMVKCANDYMHVVPIVRDLLRQVAVGEDCDGGLDDELKELEAWREKRIKDNWQ